MQSSEYCEAHVCVCVCVCVNELICCEIWARERACR